MERSYDELRNYTLGLRKEILKLRTLPITDQKAIAELSDKMILLTDYLGDVIDSTERDFQQMSVNLQQQEQEIATQSHRSLVLIKDVKDLTQRVDELQGVKDQVEKLSDIILRSLKDLPVKGADDIEEELEGLATSTWSKSITFVGSVQDDKEVEVPKSFKGSVHMNGIEMVQGRDYYYDESKTRKTLIIKGPFYTRDSIEIQGRIKGE